MTATEIHEPAEAATPGRPVPPPEDAYPEVRPARGFRVALASIGAVALAVRFMNVLWWRPTTNNPGYHGYRIGGDAYFYHWTANALAKGAWFVEPTTYHYLGIEKPSAAHPPLYSVYLALWSVLGFDTVTWHRIASCFLGTAAVVVIGLVGRRIGGNAVGLLAAGIAAVYPEMWINDGMLLSEPMAILTTAIALYALYGFARRPTIRNAVWMGLACGVAALSRTELTLLFVVAVIPVALLARRLSWKDRFVRGFVACVLGGLVLAPWVVFNLTRFADPTPLTTGTGSALSASACDETFYGRWIGYYANCFNGPWPPASADESQRDVEPRRQAIDYLEHHKGRLPFVLYARVGRLWGFYKPGDTTFLDWWLEGRGRAPSWIGLYSYYLMVPFAIGGFVVLRRRRITIIPLLAFMAIATFSAAITFGVTRYRAPAEVSLVLTASIGAVAAWTWLRTRRDGAAGREAPAATAVTGAGDPSATEGP